MRVNAVLIWIRLYTALPFKHVWPYSPARRLGGRMAAGRICVERKVRASQDQDAG